MAEVDGLGLASFLGGKSNNGGAGASPMNPAGTSPQEAANLKKDAASPNGGDVTPPNETKPKEEGKQDRKTEEQQAKKEGDKGIKEGSQAKPEEKPKTDFEKQYKDTQKWANNINQKNQVLERETLQLKAQVDILSKKLDGTYDPEKDEPKAPTTEVLTSQARALGKVEASLKMAAEIYKDQGGEQYIEKMIYAPDAPFRRFDNNPVIQAMVLNSDAPVLAAMKILEEQEFRSKWGDNPTKIEANIRKKTEEELTEKLSKDIEARIMERLGLKEKQIQGVGNARSANADFNIPESKGPRPLSSILPLG